MEIRGIDWNFDGYKKEAHFFLCGAFESFDFIQMFLKKTKECPWMLKENVVIDSVFGSPTCIWNGGRTLPIPIITNSNYRLFIKPMQTLELK